MIQSRMDITETHEILGRRHRQKTKYKQTMQKEKNTSQKTKKQKQKQKKVTRTLQKPECLILLLYVC